MPPSAQWFGRGFGHSESYLYFGGPSAEAGAEVPVPTTAKQHKPTAMPENFKPVLRRIAFLPMRVAAAQEDTLYAFGNASRQSLAPPGFSKVRSGRHGDRFFLLAEGIEAFAIGAARFDDSVGRLRFARAHLEAYRLNERCRIFDHDFRLQHVAAVDQVVALHDMEFVAMGRAVIVDEGPRVLRDGIDHQPLALVMPHRFSVPGWFRIRRMWNVHIDV